ncbi:tripartite tricarboxylate transporter substrate binding protein [uncultured Desulfovibrio sp.]|uniref:Bug family tripartite tricarboxylate transporter substrate binding protein n=1 Tax=uncultured Desulfovibrio sp. TaxID=167968 RepID=UPI0026224A40|nr:tripartite tricarboxylate transporter substrate binding protein [uncultured Desulfovibrio sp.]
MKKRLVATLLLACALCLGITTHARAEYPYDKPLNVIVPFGPGGGVDIAARILADYFQQNYNITINVINKPGGAQAIGMNEMLRARPDGYTVAFPGFSSLATTPKLTNVGYSLKDIKPVAHIAVMEPVLTTHKSSGIDTWEKFIEAAKSNPDGTVYGTTGAISTQRLYMTKLLERFYKGVTIRHAAYTSGHEVSTALLGKHITAGCQVPSNILPYVASGDFNVIAIARKERRADLPDTPTFRELFAGQLTPEDEKWIDLGAWHGFVVSKKVKDDRIAKLQPLIEKALKDPGVIEKFEKIGLSADYLPAKEFGDRIKSSSDLADEVLAGRKSLD